MKTITKKVISLFLVFILLIGALPMETFAAKVVNKIEESEQVKDSGKNNEKKKDYVQEGSGIIDDNAWKGVIDDPDVDILSYAPYGYPISFTTGTALVSLDESDEVDESPVSSDESDEVDESPVSSDESDEVDESPVSSDESDEVDESPVSSDESNEVDESPVSSDESDEVDESPVSSDESDEVNESPVNSEGIEKKYSLSDVKPIRVLAQRSAINVTGQALAEWETSISLHNPVDGTSHQWLEGNHITRLKISGVDAYCLMPGAPLHNASVGTGAVAGQSYWRKVGKSKQQMIGLILYFGKGSNDGNYLAKQVMIWETILGYRNPTTGKVTNSILANNVGGPGGSEFENAYEIINRNLENYLTAPSYASYFGSTAPTTKVSKDPTTGEWFGEMLDTTGRSDYMNLDKLNASSEAKQAGATFSKLTDGKTGLKVSFGAVEPDETKLSTLIFPVENNLNDDIQSNGDHTSAVYADKDKPTNQVLLGKAKADPVGLLFKLSKIAADTPEPPPDAPTVVTITGHKYGEYDDAGGVGGATIIVYQTKKDEVDNEDGTVKEEEKEYDPPKKIDQVKSSEDGSFELKIDGGDGDYYVEEKEGTWAKKGGYTLNGHKVCNYLTPETTGEEPVEFSISDDAVDFDDLEFDNYQQKGRITVEKQDVDTGKTPQGDGTLSGAKFRIFSVDGYDENNRPYGSTVETLTTGANGRATSRELQEGIHYCIEETNAPVGYLLYTNNKKAWYKEFVFEFDGDHDNEITDTYTLVDGMSGGDLELGGESDAPLICKNKVKQGYIKINKFLQKDIDGNPYDDDNQPKIPVPGVTFDVYLANATPKKINNDSIPNYEFRKSKTDGHLLTDEEMLMNPNEAKGHVCFIKTGTDGTATTSLLPYGKYVIVERTPLNGYDRPKPVEQWVDTKVTWYEPTHEFVPVIGGDGTGNDNNLGLEHNPPVVGDRLPEDDIKLMQTMADILGHNDYDPDYYDGYLDKSEYQIVYDYYYDYISVDHYVDKDGNEQDANGNPYDETILDKGGKKLTDAERGSYAENMTRSLILYYNSLHDDEGDGGAGTGDVYADHLQDYIDNHGMAPNTVDMLTVTLNIENQTTKRYIRIVKKDSVSGKLIPLNNFYFKVWDCSRKRWVEDNRNNASLGNVNVWQTNAQGEVYSKPGPDGSTTDLEGTASLEDFLEYGEDGYDIYEVHSHSGYYLTDQPVHFVFDGESNPKGEPIIIEFDDAPVLGNATIHKTGEGLISLTLDANTGISTPGYADVNMGGAIYGVYAAEDIKALDIDRTVRKNRNTNLSDTYTVNDRHPQTLTYNYDTLLKKNSLVETVQTDADGLATTSDLYCGKYYFKELYSPVGYTLNQVPVPFEIKDTHNASFDESDHHLNPQTPTASNPDNTKVAANIDYTNEKIRLGNVRPIQAPTLFPLEMVSVSFHNKRQKVRASFYKYLVAPVNTQTLDWTGTTVNIYAKEDTEAKTPLATLKAIGKAESTLKVNLLPGDYFAVMTLPPTEVDCATEKFAFTVKPVPVEPAPVPGDTGEGSIGDGSTGDGTETPPPDPATIPVEYSLDMGTSFQYTYTKAAEMNYLVSTPSELFQKVTFGLFSEIDILSAKDNSVVIPKDTLLQVIQIPNSGLGISSVDLPIGDYYLKEITTADGYIMDDTINHFTFYPDTDKTNITIPVTSSSFINRTQVTTNEPPEEPPTPPKPPHHGGGDHPQSPPVVPPATPTPPGGDIEIVKTSSFDGKILPNAVYGIYSAATLIQTLTTDTYGYAKSKTLAAGDYTLKEIAAPAHYQIDKKKYKFTIQSAQMTHLSVKDDPIFGTIIPENIDPTKLDGIGGNPEPGNTPPIITGGISPKTGENATMFYFVLILVILSGLAFLLTEQKISRKKKIRIFSVLFCFTILVSICIPSYAATVTKSVQTFTTRNKDEKKDFPKDKSVNGTKYQLKNVSYKIVSQKNVLKDTVIKRSVAYDDMFNKNVSAPKTLTVSEGNKNVDLKLTGVTYSSTVIKGRRYHLTAYTDYGFRSSKPEANATKKVSYQDSVTGKAVPATLPLTSVKKANEWAWKDDLTIPITFSIYDAEYYKIGDKVIPYDDSVPQLKGCETELLDALKLSPNDYKISAFSWDGEPYTQDGVMYRKAIATGSRHVARYLANYGATIALPDAPGYNAAANYEGTAKLPDPSGAKEYTIKATATYELLPTHKGVSFMQVIVPVMIGLIVVVLLIVAILYISARKKQVKEENNYVGP